MFWSQWHRYESQKTIMTRAFAVSCKKLCWFEYIDFLIEKAASINIQDNTKSNIALALMVRCLDGSMENGVSCFCKQRDYCNKISS